jgi:DNA repair exonuclease SbcCD nuclease subunit
MNPEPIAIACADLHLSMKTPACRADNWMITQAKYLKQVSTISWNLAKESSFYMGKFLPVIVAGDIFDRWNPSPELITFAMKHLPPNVFAVPGQHDLPNHRLDDMHKSGYGVLVEAGRINDLSEYVEYGNRYSLHGFGWGKKVKPLDESFEKLDPKEGKCVHIAVIHKFVWMGDYGYPGAPAIWHRDSYADKLKGFDVAVFGDNHKGFQTQIGKTTIYNCGGFIRRKTDEMNYTPRVGIIYNDGSVKHRFLDINGDKFHKLEVAQDREKEAFDMRDFLEQLEGLGEQATDFREAVRGFLRENSVPKGVEALTLSALDQ